MATQSSSDVFDHIVVWLDHNIASPGCYKILKKAFSTTIDPRSESLTSTDEKDISNLIREETMPYESSFHNVPLNFKLFDDMDKCYKFLLANKGKRIFFMTSGRLGQYIVPKLLNHDPQIFQDKDGKLYEHSIYKFCANMAEYAQWTEEFLDLNCIKMHEQ